jgi:hypothetical protein
MHTCYFFNSKNNKCTIYSKRPFDCQLYPFTIMFDEKREKIVLGIDKKCPFSAIPEMGNSIKNYFHYLVDLLEKKEIATLVARNPSFIGGFQSDVIQFSYLGALTKLIINNPEKSGFRQISLKDKDIFDRFFKKIKEPDSSQNFVNLYIWKDKNPVWWKKKGKDLEILLETDFGYIDFNSLKKFPDYISLNNVESFRREGHNVIVTRGGDKKTIALHPESVKRDSEGYVKQVLANNGVHPGSSTIKKIAAMVDSLRPKK